MYSLGWEHVVPEELGGHDVASGVVAAHKDKALQSRTAQGHARVSAAG
jgi:hypothetical protein